jgi:hypothetical protein
MNVWQWYKGLPKNARLFLGLSGIAFSAFGMYYEDAFNVQVLREKANQSNGLNGGSTPPSSSSL